LLIGCKKSIRSEGSVIRSEERGDRVLIVIEDDLWLGEVGDTIRSVLAAGIDGIVPFEPMFELDQQAASVFLHGPMTRKNVVFFTVFGDSSQFSILQNRYANPQNYFVVEGVDKKSTIENFIKNKDSIITRFHHQEIDDIKAIIKKDPMTYTPYLNQRYQLNMNLPESYKRVLVDDNFVWFKKDIASGNSNILAYSIKKDKIKADIYSKDFVQELDPIRDSIVGKYVHSIEPNTSIYMSIGEYRYRKKFNYKDYRILEMKGKWDMENSFMSGPYLSYVVDNEKENTYIIFEGFAYNPSMRKRGLMLEIEAILRSLEVI